ncbi:hypothetical protein Plhal304r1_c022g0076741 [Plasmopara halstedii]
MYRPPRPGFEILLKFSTSPESELSPSCHYVWSFTPLLVLFSARSHKASSRLFSPLHHVTWSRELLRKVWSLRSALVGINLDRRP